MLDLETAAPELRSRLRTRLAERVRQRLQERTLTVPGEAAPIAAPPASLVMAPPPAPVQSGFFDTIQPGAAPSTGTNTPRNQAIKWLLANVPGMAEQSNLGALPDEELAGAVQQFQRNATGATSGMATATPNQLPTTFGSRFSEAIGQGVNEALDMPGLPVIGPELHAAAEEARANPIGGASGFAGRTLGGFAGLANPAKAPENVLAIVAGGGAGKLVAPWLGKLGPLIAKRLGQGGAEAVIGTLERGAQNAGPGGALAGLQQAGREDWEKDPWGAAGRVLGAMVEGAGAAAVGGEVFHRAASPAAGEAPARSAPEVDTFRPEVLAERQQAREDIGRFQPMPGEGETVQAETRGGYRPPEELGTVPNVPVAPQMEPGRIPGAPTAAEEGVRDATAWQQRQEADAAAQGAMGFAQRFTEGQDAIQRATETVAGGGVGFLPPVLHPNQVTGWERLSPETARTFEAARADANVARRELARAGEERNIAIVREKDGSFSAYAEPRRGVARQEINNAQGNGTGTANIGVPQGAPGRPGGRLRVRGDAEGGMEAQAGTQEGRHPAPDEGLTVPERPETLAAQVERLVAGERTAVMIPKGTTDKVPTPKGMRSVMTPRGRFIFDPAKTTAKDIATAVKEDRVGDVLGYGISRKPAEPAGVVTVRDQQGTEVQAVVTDQANAPAVVAAAQRVARPGESVRVEPAEQVLAGRTAPAGTEGQPASTAPPARRRGRPAGSPPPPTEARPQTVQESAQPSPKSTPKPAPAPNVAGADAAREGIVGATVTSPITGKVYEATTHAQARVKMEDAEPDVAQRPSSDAERGFRTNKGRVVTVKEAEQGALEQAPRTEKQTSARKEMMGKDREALGLASLDNPGRRSWMDAMEEAQSKGLHTEDRALALADTANQAEKTRAFDDVETAGLVQYANDLKNKHAATMEKIGASKDAGEILELNAERNRIEQKFDSVSQALRSSGTEKGRALAAQKLTLDQDYSLIAVKNRAKAAKGSDLAPVERVKLEKQTKQLAEATKKVEELQREASERQAEIAMKRHKSASRLTEAERTDKIDKLAEKARDLAKKGCD